MKQLVIQSGANGQNTFSIPGADSVYHYYGPVASTSVTVPANAKYALFSSTADFFVRWDSGTPVVPSSNVVDGTGSELNPIVRSVSAGQVFKLISANADDIISIAWYS